MSRYPLRIRRRHLTMPSGIRRRRWRCGVDREGKAMRVKQIIGLALAGLGVSAFLATASAAGAEPARGPVQAPAHQAAALPPGWQLVTLPNANVPNFQRRTLYCPGAKRVLGGGGEAPRHGAAPGRSLPPHDGPGWSAPRR